MTTPRSVQWLLFVAVPGGLLYLLGPILTPFVAAAILAYICNPLVARLCVLGVPRTLSVAVVMACLMVLGVLMALILLPLLQEEWARVATRLPVLLETLRAQALPRVQQWFGVTLQLDSAALRSFVLAHLQGAGGMVGRMLPWLSDSGGALMAVLANLLLIPVALFYLLRDWPTLVLRVDELIPRARHAQVRAVMLEVDAVLAEFLRGQVAVMLVMSVFYAVALWLAGLEFALPIGMVAGMLVFVPYLGMVTGLLLATLAAAMQFSALIDVLWVWGAFAAGQLLEGMVVTPRLVGERVGLHPLAVIFALMAFGQVMGFFGVLLALPLSAILLVALRHFKRWYLDSSMYREP